MRLRRSKHGGASRLGWLVSAASAGLAAAVVAVRARRKVDLRGKVAIVCGGSRGLGRAVAEELARKGCHVAICARSPEELARAKADLQHLGVKVEAEVCDLRRPDEAAVFVAHVIERLGPVELLVANAATMTVGPVAVRSPRDFDEAMDAIFKTALNATLAVLPHMRDRGRGTIAFVTSIGGVIGVPHLAPYSAAKFAEVGFAEALRAEVARAGVRVLTIVPGLMRTGSYVRVVFKGNADREFEWFGASATAPLISIGAERAARRIVRAVQQGRSRLVYTLPARIVARTHDLMPSIWTNLGALAARLLPSAPEGPVEEREGREIQARSSSKWVALIRRRGERYVVRHAEE